MARRKNRSSQKRRRDPNAPNRGKTAWQMFFSDNREEMKVISQLFCSKVEFNFSLETKS